jgi:MFS family permease
VITQYISWPWVFFINIPIAVLALIGTRAVMPSGIAGSRGSVDVFGALTVTLGLGAAVYGIVRAPEVGWTSAQTWIALGIGVALLATFVISQAVNRAPLMQLSIFGRPNLGAANLAQVLLGAAWIPMWFFLNLYLQQVLEYTAFPSGAALLPMTVLIMIGMIALAPRVMARFGPKTPIVAGLTILAIGLGWLSLADPDGSFVVDVLPASLVAALGMSLAFIPSLGTAISAARPEEGGLASGIVNTSYQVGSALGLAAMTAVAAAFGADQLGNATALTNGFSAAFLGAGLIALGGAVLVLITLRIPAAVRQPADA